jgi:transcription initiation factor TFIIA large subunit
MTPSLPQMQQQAMPSVQQMNNNPDSRIKTEPGLENSPVGGMSQPGFQPPITSGTNAPQRAAERASSQLMTAYGPRATASINAIQSNISQGQNAAQPNMQQQMHAQQQQAMHHQQQQQMQQQMQQQRAAGMQQRPQMTQEQYQKVMAMNAMQAQQRIQQQNGVNGAQTDGAGDDFDGPAAIIKRFNADGEEELGRMEIDGLIRDRIAAMGQTMEGGGLMLPLREATNSKKRQRKVKKFTTGLAQHDGPGSDDGVDSKEYVKDEELDEDAINSDLDDPDDGLNDEEDDEDGMGHIMLCMYDKVQRVKNKW